MSKEPWDKPTDNPSLANILHKSLFIHSNTIIQRDGKVQSFCGLKIANIGATCAGRAPYTFRINGQNYHHIGSLLPKEGIHPSQGISVARDWCHSHGSINVELKLLGERTKARQYNKPTVAEVAALIINDFGDGFPTRDIIMDSKDIGPKRISELHPSYMALQYPLFSHMEKMATMKKIPHHTNQGVQKTNQGFATMKEYYAYIIQQRNDQGTTLLRGGWLFQQYLVDAFTAVEEQRLKWTRNNQDALHVDLYHNVCDTLLEISEMLSYFPGQKPYDRPKIGTRVFKLKLTQLLEDLIKNKIFGDCRGVVYVIEFQKRGLPHVHILLWLEEHYKCSTPSQTNDIISAEILCQAEDLEGYKVVTEFMVHGPCGKDAKSAPRNIEEKCSKHFP
ncbi:ATP-dependent DNA helicase PIF1-like protein [Tanacetum coccineum]